MPYFKRKKKGKEKLHPPGGEKLLKYLSFIREKNIKEGGSGQPGKKKNEQQRPPAMGQTGIGPKMLGKKRGKKRNEKGLVDYNGSPQKHDAGLQELF